LLANSFPRLLTRRATRSLAEQQRSAMEIKEGEPGMEAELAAAQLPLPNQQYDPLCLISNRITRSNKQTSKQQQLT
jgi:hypothetical protein